MMITRKYGSERQNFYFTLGFMTLVSMIAVSVIPWENKLPNVFHDYPGESSLPDRDFSKPVTLCTTCTGQPPACPNGKKAFCAPPLTKDGVTYGGCYWACPCDHN